MLYIVEIAINTLDDDATIEEVGSAVDEIAESITDYFDMEVVDITIESLTEQ
jgi:hypothetical protein